MAKEMAIKILSISDVRETSKGGVRDCVIETLDLHQQMRIGVFYNEQEWNLNMGDEVTAQISEGKPYKGQKTYSTGLDKITPFVKMGVSLPTKPPLSSKLAQPEPQKQPIVEQSQTPKEPNWDKINRIEHKRALTMIAFSLFPPQTNEDSMPEMDFWLRVKDMRDIMLTDLYND